VTFGEVLLRLSPDRPQERLFQSPALRSYFGGAEANVAAGLAALGVPADHVTRLPANALGDAAMAALRAAGVGVTHVARGGDRLGLYFVESGADLRPLRTVYDRAGSAFALVEPAHLDWHAALAGAAWFHVTGINPALGAGPLRAMTAGLDAARALGVRVSIDLNWRPALWTGRDPRRCSRRWSSVPPCWWRTRRRGRDARIATAGACPNRPRRWPRPRGACTSASAVARWR
jgi:2-dehydro-3-deoxygluconokinase